jgi:hypothetical protein
MADRLTDGLSERDKRQGTADGLPKSDEASIALPMICRRGMTAWMMTCRRGISEDRALAASFGGHVR